MLFKNYRFVCLIVMSCISSHAHAGGWLHSLFGLFSPSRRAQNELYSNFYAMKTSPRPLYSYTPESLSLLVKDEEEKEKDRIAKQQSQNSLEQNKKARTPKTLEDFINEQKAKGEALETSTTYQSPNNESIDDYLKNSKRYYINELKIFAAVSHLVEVANGLKEKKKRKETFSILRIFLSIWRAF